MAGSGKAASGPARTSARSPASAVRAGGAGRQVLVGPDGGAVGRAGGALRGGHRAFRLGQARPGGVDRVGRKRGGERRDGLLAHRARLPRDQVRAQAGDDVRAPGLVQFRLALKACPLGRGQGGVGRVPRGGGPPGRRFRAVTAGQQSPQVAEVAVRLGERRLRRGGGARRAGRRVGTARLPQGRPPRR